MVEAAPSAAFEMSEPDLLLELLEVASSNLGASTSKPFDNQRFLECSRRAADALSGTKRHQSAHSGTESPEIFPKFVLQAFTVGRRQASNQRHRNVLARRASVGQLLRLALSSDRDGEVLASLSALQRTMATSDHCPTREIVSIEKGKISKEGGAFHVRQ